MKGMISNCNLKGKPMKPTTLAERIWEILRQYLAHADTRKSETIDSIQQCLDESRSVLPEEWRQPLSEVLDRYDNGEGWIWKDAKAFADWIKPYEETVSVELKRSTVESFAIGDCSVVRREAFEDVKRACKSVRIDA